MSEQTCGEMRELIPDFVRGGLTESERALVRKHVAGCSECGAEIELAGLVLASRPAVPASLLGRLLDAVDATRQRPARTWWGISAAAVAALALGIGLSSHESAAPVEVPGYAYEVEEGEIWVSDDGLLAGAPSFDGLSDDALLQLLDELTVTSAGGTA